MGPDQVSPLGGRGGVRSGEAGTMSAEGRRLHPAKLNLRFGKKIEVTAHDQQTQEVKVAGCSSKLLHPAGVPSLDFAKTAWAFFPSRVSRNRQTAPPPKRQSCPL